MKDYEAIALCRRDLTKYVIHFTKDTELFTVSAIERLQQILQLGAIKPSLARRPNRFSKIRRPTIKGPHLAVCLGEIPLWSFIEMQNAGLYQDRYSGYGIAFHSGELHAYGGRPVIYGDESLLGTCVRPGDPLYKEKREIYTGGIPLSEQYLWARYSPENPAYPDYPIDFRWEREWRVRPKDKVGLPILLSYKVTRGAIVVERDQDVATIRKFVRSLPLLSPAKLLADRIISLETAERELPSNPDYGRIETWPEFKVIPTS